MVAFICILPALLALAGAVNLNEMEIARLQTATEMEATVEILQRSELSLESRFWNLFGPLPDNAPEWCKSEGNLSWQEQRHRIEQRATLQWAKGVVNDAKAKNETVPEWMDQMVNRDTKQGLMKWAVKEAKRMKKDGQEIPQWMADLVQEDSKWADRWAACKTAELQFAGESPPEWMVENGRKGVMAAATEKLAELQERIDELEALKEKEVALISTHGDIKLAERKLLQKHRNPTKMVTPSKSMLPEDKLPKSTVKVRTQQSKNVLNLAKKVNLAKKRNTSTVPGLNKVQ